MKRDLSLAAALLSAAACLFLSSCAQAPAAERPAQATDIYQLPGPPSAVPEHAVPPRALIQPAGLEQAEREARREGTRDLRPGAAGGERAELLPTPPAYNPKLPPLPEPKPVPPERKPELVLPSLQER